MGSILYQCFVFCIIMTAVMYQQAALSICDYKPIALTSVVMKSSERLVLSHMKKITGPLLDPLQFA